MWSGDDRNKWFALFRDDETVNNHTFINGVKRGVFRLHPAGPNRLSQGCIAVHNTNDYQLLYNKLKSTSLIEIPSEGLTAFGTIEVIGNEDALCPNSA